MNSPESESVTDNNYLSACPIYILYSHTACNTCTLRVKLIYGNANEDNGTHVVIYINKSPLSIFTN